MGLAEHTHLVVIQASPFCNINCSYCYLPNREDRRRLEPETLEQIGRFLLTVPRLADPLVLVWHAGEPLVLGTRYYERAFAILETTIGRETRLQHSFQTNGTLITDAWCDFFKRWGARVGVSIDGPRRLNDLHRVDRRGVGTFDRCMRGISLLAKHEIPYTLLAVLTRDSLADPQRVWDFVVASGAEEIGFNVEEIEGANTASSLLYAGVEDDYRFFFETLSRLRSSRPSLRIRELDDMSRWILDGEEPVQCSENVPGAILTFDVDGNCSTFSPELAGQCHPAYGSFSSGSVVEHSFESFIATPQVQRANEAVQEGVNRCRLECEYFALCGGGPPANKLAETGRLEATETLSCRLRVQTLANVVLDELEDSYSAESPSGIAGEVGP